MVYITKIKAKIFIIRDVLKKLLNGLIIKRTMIKIDVAEHMQTFFVSSVKSIKLNGAFVFVSI
jgi:hypothetical protein